MNTLPSFFPADEQNRLEELYNLNILDTDPEDEFDRLTRLAKILFGTRMAALTFVDQTRQWFKSASGLTATETPREHAFCAHTILKDSVLVVTDALEDVRFRTNPLVTGAPGIRFYAGAPLLTRKGSKVGALCVIDDQPRQEWTSLHSRLLADLAAAITSHLEYRTLTQKHTALLDEAQGLRSELAYRINVDAATGLPNRVHFEDALDYLIRKTDSTGCRLAVLSIQIANLHELVETMGHQKRDHAFQELASRVQGRIRQADLLVRSGDGGFLLLFPNLRTAENAKAIRDNLLSLLSQPVSAGAPGVQFQPRVNAGLSIYPDDELRAADLILRAENEMCS